MNNHATVLTNDIARSMLPLREGRAKWDFGRLMCVAGSDSMPGAAVLSILGAARSGTGTVRLVAPPVVRAAATALLPECTFGCLADNGLDYTKILEEAGNATAVLAGPGLGRDDTAKRVINSLIMACPKPLVLDADGLYFLSLDPKMLLRKRSGIIITPHVVEMSRLTGKPTDEIERYPSDIASNFAQKYGVIVVLKGPMTYVAAPNGAIWLNDRPNTGLSKGGSGDVLAGVIASLAAQSPDLGAAAVAGVFIHSLAGSLARRSLGVRSMLPRDVIDFLPSAFIQTSDDWEI